MKNVSSAPRTCNQCAQPFLPVSNRQRRCKDCNTHRCRYCGTVFVTTRHRRVAFCSPECTNNWQATNEAKDAARLRTIAKRGKGEVRRCVTCGQSFYVTGWRVVHENRKYCSHACRDYPADMKGVKRQLRVPTRHGTNSLERAGRRILEGIGVRHLEQQIIGGKFVVDVLVPDARLVIQWDGDFWHGNPALFSARLWPVQVANQKRDRACNAYLAKCGYRVLRFWESDVHSRPFWVAAEVERALASSAST